MQNVRQFVALLAALVLVCGVIAWEWYSRAATPKGVPSAVQAIPRASAPQQSASTKPSATPAPVVFVIATPQPAASSTSAPGAVSPTPIEAGTSAPAAAPLPAVTLPPSAVVPAPIREAADAPPQIIALSISEPVVHGGDLVSGTVETSSNVASVEARIGGYSSSLQKIGVGRFKVSYRVPHLPFFLHRTFMIQVIARNTRGLQVSTAVPITVR